MNEQLQLDLAPRTVEERTAEFLAYLHSRRPWLPYDPCEAPVPF